MFTYLLNVIWTCEWLRCHAHL